jgi:BASS family bile acid:Na+ symporter
VNVDDIRIAFDSGSLTTLKIVLGLILFGIAMDTELEDFRLALTKPKAFAVAILAQFALLPALTFLLTLALGVGGSVALGMILVACCPPGNVSNILTHRAKGDVALSVSMTAVGNVLAIVMLPVNFSFWGHLHPTGRDHFAEIRVAPWDMLSEVLLVIALPFALGLAVSHLLPAFAARTHRVVGILSFVALGGIIVIAVANNWALFVAYIGVVALAVFLHDALALGLGYAIARGFRLDVPARKAMTFEVGIRNAGLGLLFVFTFFGGLGGMALVAAWWGVWDIIAGLVVAVLWARRTRAVEQEPVA